MTTTTRILVILARGGLSDRDPGRGPRSQWRPRAAGGAETLAACAFRFPSELPSVFLHNHVRELAQILSFVILEKKDWLVL